MFFQQPSWLEEWLAKYPRRARKVWPYWAAARADTVRRWPELFSRLVRISAHRDRRFRDRDRTFRPMMTAHFG
jgi:hypothetical protein